MASFSWLLAERPRSWNCAKDLLDQTGGDLTSASGKPAGRSAGRRAPLGAARSRFPNKRGCEKQTDERIESW